MNRPKLKVPIFLAIFFLIFGIIFSVVGNSFPTPEDILENGGEKLNAIVLDYDSEETYTRVQIDDEDSFYDGDIIEVSQYSSRLYTGMTTTVYYDGETLILSEVSFLPTLFTTIGNIAKGIAGLIFVITLIRFIVFVAKVGVAGLTIGSIANEVQQQEKFNNQFYGNSAGRTTNPYDTQGYPQYDNQQYQNNQYQNYQQPYNNQQTYNQQYQQGYDQQQYNQQYQSQQYQQQNNGNGYYNQ